MAKNVDKSRESINIINVTLAIINNIIAIMIINVTKYANTFMIIYILLLLLISITKAGYINTPLKTTILTHRQM